MAFILTFFQTLAFAAVDPTAYDCVQKYVAKYERISGYRTFLKKLEWDGRKQLNDQYIEVLVLKPKQIVFTYRNEGNTGIRNNGMRPGFR
jgi:hypothetical protein